jgi:hypothetical protein
MTLNEIWPGPESRLGTACDERLGKAEGLGERARLARLALGLDRQLPRVPTERRPSSSATAANTFASAQRRVSASLNSDFHTACQYHHLSLSRTSTAVAHISHTSRPHVHPPPNMSARQQQMGRPGGARFAQFKLVLLGMPNLPPDTLRICMLTMLSQANPPSERCATTSEACQHDIRATQLTHRRVRSSFVSSRTSSTTTENPLSAPLSSPKQSPSMIRLPSSSRSGIPQVKSATSLWLPCTTATPTAPL